MNTRNGTARRTRGVAAAVVALAAGFGAGGTGEAAQEAPAAKAGAGAGASALADEVAELLVQGRSADAENRVRDELRSAPSPALELELAGVLRVRAGELEATSEFGRSLQRGVLEEALAAYRAARAGDPALDVATAIGIASCHVLLGREAEAEATLREAIAASGDAEAGRAQRRPLASELVRFLALRGRVEPAREVIAAMVARGDLPAKEAVVEELRIAASRKDGAAAQALAFEAVKSGGDPYEVCFLAWDALGETAFETKLSLYSRLLDSHGAEPAFRYYRGATRLFMGDGAGAAEDLASCIDDARFGERARGYLGRALLVDGRAEEALVHFTTLLGKRGEATKEALDGLIGVAVARARARKFADALPLYEQVLARDPWNGWAHLGVPLCHRSLGDLERAAAAYEAGLAALPDDAQLLNDYGLLRHARGERKEARELFERALGAGSADGGENLGVFALRDDGDARAAADSFARALAIDPSRPRLRFYRELCLAGLATR